MLVECPHQAAAERRLEELQQNYPLPAGCVIRDSLFDRAQVGEIELGMVGLAANLPGGLTATGSAASCGAGLPVDRAFFELLERIAILHTLGRAGTLAVRDRSGNVLGSHPVRHIFPREHNGAALRASRSNGVALHTTWSAACTVAQCELLERDRVLRSFRGEFAPQPRAHDADEIADALRAHYTLEAYEFSPAESSNSAHVRGLFLFAHVPEAPLAYGFAAALSEADARLAAQREALQRLAFLWGEALPATAPAPSPTPDYHQDYYLYPPHHTQLRAWLTGAHRLPVPNAASIDAHEDFSFVDLTPESWSGGLAIARAISPHALQLHFGARRTARSTPPHPIA